MSKMVIEMEYLSIDGLIDQNADLISVLGWKKSDLQMFHECKLLLGKYEPENSKIIDDLKINVKSFERLVEYHKSLDNCKKDYKNLIE
ncbi:MAG: hypothetical protein COA32_07415 [Fluviicola sp.]|nr:MAG: hypothetical protein COA32_07415 [Fluviicola sp.]